VKKVFIPRDALLSMAPVIAELNTVWVVQSTHLYTKQMLWPGNCFPIAVYITTWNQPTGSSSLTMLNTALIFRHHIWTSTWSLLHTFKILGRVISNHSNQAEWQGRGDPQVRCVGPL